MVFEGLSIFEPLLTVSLTADVNDIFFLQFVIQLDAQYLLHDSFA